MAVASNFSKLIIDPGQPISSAELIRTQWEDGSPISFNADGYRLWERLSDYYLEYAKVLREVLVFLEGPRIAVSVHSHAGAEPIKVYSPS